MQYLLIIFSILLFQVKTLAESSFYVNESSYQFDHIANEISQEVYAKFRNKWVLLQSNFILEKTGSKYSFYTYDSSVCGVKTIVAATTPEKYLAAEIIYQKKITVEGVIHQVNYVGCGGKPLLIEKIFSDDKTQTSDLSESEILTLNRRFKLSATEKIRRHLWLDAESLQPVFFLQVKKQNENQFFDISIVGASVISMHKYLDRAGATKIQLHRKAYSLSFKKPNFNVNSTTDGTLLYSLDHSAQGLRFIKNSSLNPISEDDYIHVYSNYYVGRVTQLVDGILQYYFKLLPSTKVVQVQSANNKMVNELSEAYLRVTNKENLDLVAQLLLRYIQDVKDGKIQDNR